MYDPERIERDRATCALANNITAPPSEPYCEGTFDSWLCWPHTRANTTAFMHCPDFVPGFNAELFAQKECTENGTWFQHPISGLPWSNYTTCTSPDHDVSNDVAIIAIYMAGNSVSLVAMLLSLAIFLNFRNLRCTRVTMHMNLFASFALNSVLWLAWYGGVIFAPETLLASPVWCRVLNAVLQYGMLTTYTWMLCEGLYLHTVLVSTFASKERLLLALLALGWALPLVPTVVYTLRNVLEQETLCWMGDDIPHIELVMLAGGAMLINLGLLCNIVRVLYTKLRAGRVAGPVTVKRPSAAALHALRATCLLAPLLGLQYVLLSIYPPRTTTWGIAYEYVAALTTSLQGFCVAVLYCFCNGEVLAQLRRR